jgi:hypothetical protein
MGSWSWLSARSKAKLNRRLPAGGILAKRRHRGYCPTAFTSWQVFIPVGGIGLDDQGSNHGAGQEIRIHLNCDGGITH